MIKKRTIIAIIVTIVTIITTNKLWLIFKPMPVDFDIKGKGQCNINVQLNKKDNDKFNKIKSQSIILDLNKNTHASFNVKRSRFPKRIKFVITGLEENSPVEMSNITLRNGKYNLDDLKQFSNSTGNLGIKKNSLIIYPDNNVINLEYKKTLQVRTAIKFDFKLFVIISILTYLLAYKLSNYIADFKTVKNKSRLDIIFLTIFFVFLFIPMSNINKDEISAQENRPLAKLQPFIYQDGEINYDFGKNFNEWFNDRFYLRQKFVNFRNSFTMFITNKCEKGIFDTDTKTMYPNWSFGHIDIKTVKTNFSALYELDQFCKKHGIKLYILIVPQKADVQITKYNFIKDTNKHEDFLNYISELQQVNNLKIIYPYNKMREAVSNGKLLYFKTEHHWTDDGAFIGYQELMKVISNDYPNIKILNANDFDYFYDKNVRGDFFRNFNFGQDCERMGISKSVCKKYHQYDYTYYKYKDFDNLKTTVINTEHHLGKLYDYDKGANYKVIQLGTSQNENLTEFIPFTFKHVKRLRNNNVQGIKAEEEFKLIKYYKDEILEYKPNIIIFCITYNNISELHKLFEE